MRILFLFFQYFFLYVCSFSLRFFLFFYLWLLFYFLDPVVDNIDENLLNLAYSDQHIDSDGDDEIMRTENRKCCKGIFTGSQHDEDQIRESTLGNYG